MIDKLTGAFNFHQEALNLRDQRQKVLASNIANADTPNYKARDFDFAAELKRAVDQGRSAQATNQLQRTHNGHIAGSGAAMSGVQTMQFTVPAQSRLDGNTVDMDLERSKFLDNSVRYQASLTFVNSRISGLRNAMQPE
ncbi:flagellar basal body rod protein FlgB [Aliidiomarina halalkaliphila]|uniref:Flagellar basal body rod protein FlgB n=1 Tax=Aliidiomarina halalkaliphila TaxID=2593535 RepID=A0A552X2F9_9GAMM|nr:flagellar basal body rod protein FlgB [Aliidiomarina halalkaliphila]TRW48803.1 flagellar basal body rod protein FlgB [Aliidiomarina halalkaliphila]